MAGHRDHWRRAACAALLVALAAAAGCGQIAEAKGAARAGGTSNTGSTTLAPASGAAPRGAVTTRGAYGQANAVRIVGITLLAYFLILNGNS